MARALSGGDRISLLVSDIDGTLVTNDKRLTPGIIAAAEALKSAGVRLSLVSSRPPMGFKSLAETLKLDGPIGAFNGGMILNPDLGIIEQTLVPEHAARIALRTFAEFEVEPWLMTADSWYVLRGDGDYVAKERLTIRYDPAVVTSFDGHMGAIGKLVGSSRAFDRLKACESALRERLDGAADAKRSQDYYLDVTPAGFDKGVAAKRIAAVLGIPLEEVAVIGDMANDLPMFAVAPHRIAMGNGIEDLKAQASFVTASNEENGFAKAVHDYVLPRAPLPAQDRTSTP